ncbi:enoyl-CoA hydratase-related protein [Thalassotalea psychrophila]|uniref:Enoyl-CoA hydratase-related protein n=1 Tax=Thalassotalea psychrophila TaxID=3065647 RepID=A0ABY9U0F5_9GAMM|nr:enoyl-CoA hydratase-related protein [Colwelliaceae bacterium SQ149]
MNQHILIEENHGVYTITLNRLDKKNALSAAMYNQLTNHFNYANEQDNIHCILIKGDENCFCAGNDLADFVSTAKEDLPALDFIKALANVRKPIVAAVAGPAIGIGTTMLLHCDMIIAASNCKFALPFTKLGLCLEAGSSLLLPAKVGANKAFELAVLGELFSAEQALEYGLVNQVCQSNELIEKAESVARTIANLPADAVQTSRKLIRQSTTKLLAEVLDNEAKEFVRLVNGKHCQSILAGK